MQGKKSLLLTATFFLLLFAVIHPANISLRGDVLNSKQDNINNEINKAQRLNSNAQYEQAIELLNFLLDNKAINARQKQKVLWELGYAYTAKRHMDQVQTSMTKMLELEPPIVDLKDPDAEEWPRPMLNAYYQARKEMKGGYQDSLWSRPSPGIKTMAMLDFSSNISAADQEKWGHIGKGFADMLIVDMSKTTKLKVIERERIQWILREIELENDPGKFDVETAVRVGKLIGTHLVFFGSLTKIGDQITVSGRLVKTETGEFVSADYMTGKPKDLMSLSKKFALQLFKELDIKISKLEKKEIEGVSEISSIEAMLSYSAGMDFLDKQNYKKAFEKFQEALKIDPNYKKAQQRISSIKPLIG